MTRYFSAQDVRRCEKLFRAVTEHLRHGASINSLPSLIADECAALFGHSNLRLVRRVRDRIEGASP